MEKIAKIGEEVIYNGRDDIHDLGKYVKKPVLNNLIAGTKYKIFSVDEFCNYTWYHIKICDNTYYWFPYFLFNRSYKAVYGLK